MAAHLGLQHKHHDALSDARVAGRVVVHAMQTTGLDMKGYLAAPWRDTPRKARPAASASGPLHGERVVVIASPHSTLAAEIAAAGGRVMASVGRTMTLLVVAGTRPFSSGVRSSTDFLKAEAFAGDGGTISILTAHELRDRIASATISAQMRSPLGTTTRRGEPAANRAFVGRRPSPATIRPSRVWFRRSRRPAPETARPAG